MSTISRPLLLLLLPVTTTVLSLCPTRSLAWRQKGWIYGSLHFSGQPDFYAAAEIAVTAAV